MGTDTPITRFFTFQFWKTPITHFFLPNFEKITMKKRVFGVHHLFVVKLEKIGQRQIDVKIISVICEMFRILSQLDFDVLGFIQRLSGMARILTFGLFLCFCIPLWSSLSSYSTLKNSLGFIISLEIAETDKDLLPGENLMLCYFGLLASNGTLYLLPFRTSVYEQNCMVPFGPRG